MKEILIVDDDRPLLNELDRMLSARGYSVACVEDAEAGVDAVRRHNFDIILLDYRLPGKDGAWFMRHVTLPENTKVLLLTSYANRQLIGEMMRLGASGHLVKPVDEDELLVHLEPETAVPAAYDR